MSVFYVRELVPAGGSSGAIRCFYKDSFRLPLKLVAGPFSPIRQLSALALLMLGVLANDHYFALALDDLALFAHGFYGRSDFHLIYLLLASPGDAAAGDVIGGHLNRDFVAGKYPNKVHPELTGNMRQNDVAVADIHLEHCVGQGFNHRALEFDYIVFCQSKFPPKSVVTHSRQISSAIVSISGSPSVMRIVFS